MPLGAAQKSAQIGKRSATTRGFSWFSSRLLLRRRSQWRRWRLVSCSQQLTLDPVVISFFSQLPAKSGGFSPPQAIANCGLTDAQGLSRLMINKYARAAVTLDQMLT